MRSRGETGGEKEGGRPAGSRSGLAPEIRKSGLAGLEVDARGLEQTGAVLVFRTLEGFESLPGDGETGESGLFHNRFELCFQQAAGNSPGPQVDVVAHFVRDRFVHQDVGDLHASARLEDAENLPEHAGLVGAEVDHAV